MRKSLEYFLLIEIIFYVLLPGNILLDAEVKTYLVKEN